VINSDKLIMNSYIQLGAECILIESFRVKIE